MQKKKKKTHTHAFQSLFKKVAGFIKKKQEHRCFPVKFAKLLRTPILKNICKQLFLKNSTGAEEI